MSGFYYPPPIFISSVYNPGFYLSLDPSGYLTYAYAQTLYLSRNDYRLSYITGITAGLAAPGVAMVLDNNSSISGISSINSLEYKLNGTTLDFSGLSFVTGVTAGTGFNSKALVLSATGTITSGITSLTMTNLILGTNTLGAAEAGYLISITPGVAQNSKALILNSTGSITSGLVGLTASGTISAATLSATTLTGTLSTAAQTAITSVGTLGSLTVSGAISSGSITTTSTNTINTYGITLGAGGISSSGSISVSGTSTVSAYGITAGTGGLTGSIKTASQTAITAVGTLGSLTVTGAISSGSITTSSTNTVSTYGITLGAGGMTSSGNISSSGTITATSGYYVNNLMLKYSFFNSVDTILSTTARANAYPLSLIAVSDTIGGCTGICFTCDSTANGNNTDMGNLTPSCSIVCERVATGYGPSDMVFYTRSGNAQTSALARRMTISYAGQTSFGSTVGAQNINLLTGGSCAFRLGASESTKNCFTMQYTYAGAASDNNAVSFDCYGSNNTLVIKSNGQVGIGAAPGTISNELYVNGWARVNQSLYVAGNSSSIASYVGNWSSPSYWAIGSDATVGAIRVGVVSATNGNTWSAYVPLRGGAYTNASDQRIKTGIVDLPYGLNEVMAMRPRQFKMIQENLRTRIGFIAQELHEVIPEPVEVGYNDDLNENGLPINSWGIDLASLTSVLCKAIQELNAKVEEQRAEIVDLLNRVSSLESNIV